MDVPRPRFSWEIASPVRGTMQTAFQIQVSDDPERLERGPFVWDSGKVDSDDSSGCEYAGPKLEARKRYYWRVRIWDEKSRTSRLSNPAFFEMGLLTAGDWEAKWIESPESEVLEESSPLNSENILAISNEGNTPPEERLKPSLLWRRTFSAKGGVRRARLYATAHGVYRLHLNGRRVGNEELSPGMSSYGKYLSYQTYDVTELLRAGENIVAATVADGWYAGRIGFLGDSCQYGNKLALLLQLEIEYGDGSRQVVPSDNRFVCSDGPFVYSDIFIGEKYDARLGKSGWDLPGYDAAGWKAAREADYGFENLAAQYGEPVRVVEEIVPVGVLTTPKGETILDLGQNIAGRLRMKVSGPAGTRVTLEHTEVLDSKGNFLNNIIGRNKDQADIYILSGKGEEIFEPQFTYHGFRYVRITGYPGVVKIENFRGVVISSDMERTGTFECSDERFNRLVKNIFWSQRANMISIPTDCPQRERAGWTGDIQVFSPTACFNMDVHAFLTRWLHSVRADQLPDGEIPMVVPYLKAYHALADAVGSDTSAGWGDACVVVPWVLYNNYGDKRILEQSYGCMKNWVEYIRRTAENEIPDDLEGEMTPERREWQKYLWNTGFHYGDWLIPSLSMSKDGSDVDMFKSAVMTKALVPSCFYAYSTDLLSQIASLLGKTDDAARYAELNKKIRAAFASEYVREDGSITANFQGIYVLTLQMKMVPDNMRGKVLAQLLKLIDENHGRMDVGFLSVPFFLDVLCNMGRRDKAVEMIHQTECPSWLYEVEKGATTMWEAWQAILPDGTVTSVSFNHYAFGCVGDWIYRHIAGLDKDLPGYKHIVVKPEKGTQMTYAGLSYHSIRGPIKTFWKELSGRFFLHVEIPANATATVYLPSSKINSARELSGIPKGLEQCPEITSLKVAGDKTVFDCQSGAYDFAITL